ncbi:hypothetical protein CB1_000714004 [Camelus ferus]|nr:hypothetical protein CB1_000714004 [Camelus ferus]
MKNWTLGWWICKLIKVGFSFSGEACGDSVMEELKPLPQEITEETRRGPRDSGNRQFCSSSDSKKDPESSQVQQLGATHRAVPRPPESHSAGEREHWECEIKPKPRPANLRHAVATIIITGVVCGIVCLMMLVAAIYGCTYAAITAQYHGGRLTQTNEPVKTEGKELFDSSPA